MKALRAEDPASVEASFKGERIFLSVLWLEVHIYRDVVM